MIALWRVARIFTDSGYIVKMRQNIMQSNIFVNN